MRFPVRLLASAVVLASSSFALAEDAPGVKSPEAAPPPAPASAPESAPVDEASAPVAAPAPAPVEAAPAPPPPPPVDKSKARWHPRYAAELEVHATIAAFDKFFVGMGGGARVNIPVWTPFKGFDNDLGVGFGLDVVRYAAYKPADPLEPTLRVATYYVPLYLQWNVWLGARASLFLEPTLLYRYAEYIDSCTSIPGNKPCAETTRFLPTLSAGMRFRIIDKVSGTIRVGWPMATLGASWL